MTLSHLRYFVTLAHVEHYTKASEILNISQPSLTYTIHALEKELGIKLFDKSGRNVVLTKCGMSFLKDAEAILARLDDSISRLQLAGSGSGEIVIAFLRTLGMDFIPWLMDSFSRQYQDGIVHFRPYCDKSLSIDIIAGLKNRKYDIAFCSIIEEESSVDFFPVFQEELVLITPPDHPLAQKKSVTLEDTLAYKQITFKKTSGLYRSIYRMFMNTVGRTPDSVYELEEDQVIAGFVSHGFAIAIVPNMQILKSMDVAVIPLENSTYERNFYMATLKDAYHTPLLNAFIKFVKEYANTYTP
jgi:DNA-binding transcriptional LysR family regulator